MGRLNDTMIETLYEYGKKVFRGELKDGDAVSIVRGKCPEIAEASVRHYILLYSKLRRGEFLTWNSNSKLLLFYVKRITEDEGIDQGRIAASAVKKYVSYAGRKTMTSEIDAILDTETSDLLKDAWWPTQDDDPINLSKEEWKRYLVEVEIPDHPQPIKMLKGMMELGGEVSCKQLSDTYGGDPKAYAGCIMNLGRRIKKYFNLPACMDGDQERYFPFPFLGKYRGGSEDNYLYRIRPELLAALQEINLSNIDPHYEEDTVEDDNNMTTKEKVTAIKSYIGSKGFNYEGDLIENFYLSLKSKPFVILAGTSGTGKTKLVEYFAKAIDANMLLVPVRPDWSDSSDLFGHKDLSGQFRDTDILKFIKKASEDTSKPYILCFDEMNLARVEYYMSDFLSIIETREYNDKGNIVTKPLIEEEYCRCSDGSNTYGKLGIPENLYIVGTVNMDETTFPFSKKVLDRANTIEFSYVNLCAKPKKDGQAVVHKLGNEFLRAEYLHLRDCSDEELVDDVCLKLEDINQILLKANLHVGYRVRDELAFYMLNNKNAELLDADIAFDHEIMQKILPRIQGSSSAIEEVLSELFIKCAGDYNGFSGISEYEQMNSYIEEKQCKYPNSAKKIAFMMRRFKEDGFTSYWL